MNEADYSITEDWLKSIGFKWHQLDRQPSKHWLLWIGGAAENENRFQCSEDLGIELAWSGWHNSAGQVSGFPDEWHCWLRADSAGRYHRFIHIRHLKTRRDLLTLIHGLIGRAFQPEDCFYGILHTPDQAEKIRRDNDRLDKKLLRDGYPWAEIEKDDSMGRALPEHREAYEKAREK